VVRATGKARQPSSGGPAGAPNPETATLNAYQCLLEMQINLANRLTNNQIVVYYTLALQRLDAGLT